MNEPIVRLGRLTRSLARLRGGRPLLESVVRHYANDEREIEMDDFDGDLRLRLRLSEHMESRIFWFGSYSRDVLRVLAARLRPGDVFFDVGANIGEITLHAAKRVRPRGAVFAIEPHPGNAARLAGHVRANALGDVTIVESAVGSREGVLPLYAPSARGRDGLNNSGLYTAYATRERDVEIGRVNVTTIDAIVAARGIARVDALKIDIEGGERDAIEGAEETLRRFRPWLVLEVNRETCEAAGYAPETLLAQLRTLGYRFHRIGRRGVLESIGERDLRDFQNVLCTGAGPDAT
jgi:FkbM family methyltransferase